MTDQEVEEEARIKIRALEKCALLGLAESYGQRHWRKDGTALYLISQTVKAADFIALSSAEQGKRVVIRARREALYELGPKQIAHLKVREIYGPLAFMERKPFGMRIELVSALADSREIF